MCSWLHARSLAQLQGQAILLRGSSDSSIFAARCDASAAYAVICGVRLSIRLPHDSTVFKRHSDVLTGTRITGPLNARGVGKNRDFGFRPVSDRGKLRHLSLVVSGGVC